MACGGCKGGGNRHGAGGDLKKFAFLTPSQLELLRQQEEQAEKDKKEGKE